MRVFVRACVCACAEHGTGAKDNREEEKNTMGLAHSRASRYHRVTNRKCGQRAEPAQAPDGGQRRKGCTCGCVSVHLRPCRQLQHVHTQWTQQRETGEVCVMVAALLCSLGCSPCVCVCLRVCGWVCSLCSNTSSWETVGGMQSVPCPAFWGWVISVVSIHRWQQCVQQMLTPWRITLHLFGSFEP